MHKYIVSLALGLGLFATSMGLALAAPTPKAPEQKPLATCADGQVEYSATGEHRGACSGHGGVASWADGSPVKSHGRTTSYRKAGK